MTTEYDNWFVRVGGESYGPYTHALMSRFVAEGRVSELSEISADPHQGWFAAARYPQFAQWQIDGPSQTAQPVATAGPVTRHLVMAELQGGNAIDFLRVVQGYMQCTRIGDAVWLVDGAGDTNALTHALRLTLQPSDRLFVVDITGQATGQSGFREASRAV